MNCKKLIDSWCSHYRKKGPPEDVCAVCEHFVEDRNDPRCDKHTYNDNFCLDRSDAEIFNWVSRTNCDPKTCELLNERFHK